MNVSYLHDMKYLKFIERLLLQEIVMKKLYTLKFAYMLFCKLTPVDGRLVDTNDCRKSEFRK